MTPGRQLLALVSRDHDGVHEEHQVDQVIANHGTRPLDELYLGLKGRSLNQGTVDYDAPPWVKGGGL